MDTYKNASKTLSQAEQQKLDKDLAARLEALDITRSFIVQAPAGSGKTGLLTQRFLKLLANVENPEDILAITFTNKAVGEMQERIMQALRQASVAEEEPANKYEAQVWNLAKEVIQRDREKRWELLANPARLRIRTIDSFCSYLAKNLPVSSNFGCLLDTDGQSEKLYSQAAAQAVNFLLTYAVQPAEEFSPWQTESEPSGTKIDVRCRKLAEELQAQMEAITDEGSAILYTAGEPAGGHRRQHSRRSGGDPPAGEDGIQDNPEKERRGSGTQSKEKRRLKMSCQDCSVCSPLVFICPLVALNIKTSPPSP